ncbi:MAG: hypothetical protein IPI00_15195 [Flavobacteriales bacterium]|nr:hypothetical protein [Flavobacteriales bacterium]MBK7241470.1 hypothetical protein [Flavobacteriales bacterium]MBK9535085.1 hypothetical protein [Flavobacteriales bacterium]MBP9139615.1 hypothetical protein [Flavobacteriales bacterium]HQX30978.1 hypothetical protein [Flavobacteriales bacterium]
MIWDYFELYTSDKLNCLITGENVLNIRTALFIASFIMVLPPLVIALSLLVKL